MEIFALKDNGTHNNEKKTVIFMITHEFWSKHDRP